MNKKLIFFTLISFFLIFLLLYLIYKITNLNKINNLETINKILPDDNIKWSKNKKNLLIEYSDYQCPACKSLNDFLKTIESSNSPYVGIKEKITFIYRHFPLYQIHKNAFSAAYAAEAAGLQGKFWEMNDLLFENQNQWSNLNKPETFFINLAKKLNLNIEKFEKDLKSEIVFKKVNNHLKQAQNFNFYGTPTLILNGKILKFNSLDELVLNLKNLK